MNQGPSAVPHRSSLKASASDFLSSQLAALRNKDHVLEETQTTQVMG